jgi:hypothetical protein
MEEQEAQVIQGVVAAVVAAAAALGLQLLEALVVHQPDPLGKDLGVAVAVDLRELIFKE